MLEEPKLIRFLESQVKAGIHSSSGRFSLRHLSLIPDRCLPNTEWWCLKVLQALVALGAERISVQCGSRFTTFEAEVEGGGTVSVLEQALCQPHRSTSPALEHMRRGLWSVCGHEERSFWLKEPGSPYGLRSIGRQLQRWKVPKPDRLCLRVSHRAHKERLSAVTTWCRRAAVLEQMDRRAFFCPVSLTVNGHCADPLQTTALLGVSTQPLAFGLCGGEGAAMRVPFHGLLNSRSLKSGPLQMSKVLVHTLQSPSRVEAACMIGLGETIPSMLYWVHDGVIVGCEGLEISAGVCNCSIFASAEGLDADESGLRLKRNQLYARRFNQVLQGLLPFLNQRWTSPAEWLRRQKSQGRLESVALLLAGLVSLLVEPGVCWLWFLGSILAYRQHGWDVKDRESAICSSLARLKGDFRRMLDEGQGTDFP